MTALAEPFAPEWRRGLALAAGGHGLVGLALLLAAAHRLAPVEPPALMVEMPPLSPGVGQMAERQPLPLPSRAMPAARPMPVDAPPPMRPLPSDAVTLPPHAAPAPVAAAPASVAFAPAAPAPAVAAPLAAAQAAVAAPSVGDDPRAAKAQATYYQQLMAWLARRKDYPAEARQARQQGVVIVRFTIDRAGNVSAEAVKRSSGYAALDAATLALLRRASPVPALPAAMKRDSLTVALPIEYSLSTR